MTTPDPTPADAVFSFLDLQNRIYVASRPDFFKPADAPCQKEFTHEPSQPDSFTLGDPTKSRLKVSGLSIMAETNEAQSEPSLLGHTSQKDQSGELVGGE